MVVISIIVVNGNTLSVSETKLWTRMKASGIPKVAYVEKRMGIVECKSPFHAVLLFQVVMKLKGKQGSGPEGVSGPKGVDE